MEKVYADFVQPAIAGDSFYPLCDDGHEAKQVTLSRRRILFGAPKLRKAASHAL